ncbi:MAG TPA: HAMP domain-containing sensor histidine kinase [Chloroflexota bacterium]|nr:HAMP domain-containing sensor histidine kinase [Chloroflexota bacterium]
MEASAREASDGEDALALTALRLLGEGATAATVAERFSALGAEIEPARVAALLTRLVALGLVCTAAVGSGDPFYVPTSLGQEHAGASDAGQADVVARLEELEQLRTDLLATVAHELRTPLTAVRTCVGLLLDPTTSPDAAAREQLLHTIERSADRMQRVLADLLDLARFRAGRVQLQLRRFDARQLARDTAVVITPLLQSRGQTLDLVLPKTPVWVYGDHRRLEQVVLNLLSNAHKFSPDGGRVRLAVGATGDAVSWSVTDEGPGIAVADQRRLFERFFTVDSRAGGSRAGAGLGLPIARAIALAHGGTIAVTTAEGQGSTFTLRVPAQGPAETEEP